MKLLNSIFTTLIVCVLSSWIMAIYLVSRADPADKGGFLGFIILVAGNMFLGAFFAVYLFALLKEKIGFSNRLVKYLAQTGLVLVIMAIGVCLGSIFRASAFTSQRFMAEFDSSYKGYIPVVLIASFLTPPVYYWISQLTWSPQNK